MEMAYQRKKLKIEMKKIDIVFEALSLIVLLAVWVYTIISWQSLPDTIPTHMNSSGDIDAYGSKSTLYAIAGVILAMYLIFTLISRFPYQFNYIVKINADNERSQYVLALTMLRVVKLEIICLFGYMQVVAITAAQSNSFGIGKYLLPVVAFLILVTAVTYIFLSMRENLKVDYYKHEALRLEAERLEAEKLEAESLGADRLEAGEDETLSLQEGTADEQVSDSDSVDK